MTTHVQHPPQKRSRTATARRSSAVRFCPETRIYLFAVSRPHAGDQGDEQDEAIADRCWYSRDELTDFQSDIRKVVRKMRRNVQRRRRPAAAAAAAPSSSASAAAGAASHPGPLHTGNNDHDSHDSPDSDDNGNICERGLEHLRSAAHVEQVRINRDCAIQAVLEQQRRMRDAGLDPNLNECVEALAEASRMHSEWARNVARRFGGRDAVDAIDDREEPGARCDDDGDDSSSKKKRSSTSAAAPTPSIRPAAVAGGGMMEGRQKFLRQHRLTLNLLGLMPKSRNPAMA